MRAARVVPGKGVPMDEAGRALAEQVRASGSSFYWAMRLLPAHRRAGLYAIYAFCRAVDDIADDAAMSAPDKQAALRTWHARIDTLATATDALGAELHHTMTQFMLDRADFHAVIDGMEMDALGPIVAPTSATLDLYCDRVASAVGRLCNPVFGEISPQGQQLAHHLGRALQLTNIIRDVEEDSAMGRLYLPSDILAAAGIATHDPMAVSQHPQLHVARAALGVMAKEHFTAATMALNLCNRRAVRPAKVMMQVYKRLWQKMAKNHWLPLPQPAGLAAAWDKVAKIAIALRYGLGPSA